MQEAQKSS